MLVALRDHEVAVEEEHADWGLIEQRPEPTLGTSQRAPGLLDLAEVDELTEEALDAPCGITQWCVPQAELDQRAVLALPHDLARLRGVAREHLCHAAAEVGFGLQGSAWAVAGRPPRRPSSRRYALPLGSSAARCRLHLTAMIAAGEASSRSCRFSAVWTKAACSRTSLGDVLEDRDEVLRLGAKHRDVQAQAERPEVDLKLLGLAACGDATVGLKELGVFLERLRQDLEDALADDLVQAGEALEGGVDGQVDPVAWTSRRVELHATVGTALLHVLEEVSITLLALAQCCLGRLVLGDVASVDGNADDRFVGVANGS